MKATRVLLVDDHLVVRNGLQLILATADDIVVAGEAGSAQEALRLAAEMQFDVAVIDIAMPGKNGLELLKQLRIDHPTMAVLVLSMYAEEVYAIRALRHGAAGYLTKDSPAAAIISAIRHAAAGRKYVTPALADRLADLLGGHDTVKHESLSDRELEVLKLLASGSSLVQIAELLHLSPSTVTTYRLRILEKTGLKSNAGLARYALENGLIS